MSRHIARKPKTANLENDLIAWKPNLPEVHAVTLDERLDVPRRRALRSFFHCLPLIPSGR